MTDQPVLRTNKKNRPHGVPEGRFFSPALRDIQKSRLSRHFQGKQTPECDSVWTEGELAQAALYLACPPQYRLYLYDGQGIEVPMPPTETFPPVPFMHNKESRIQQLTSAAALIACEIDRLISMEEEDFLNQ